ncbi:DHA2 family efflux MFS transporter permease subunit [Mesoterricola silvestris]|uniref:EmrB/QacA family drug resistance transporter n=1 Tax=Mesoterricola silvestris TaxID=2927979 RepID=A0AA48KAQ3_9BACT|nr:DHA2 family efflux MFS transporter permease subunit [Mesoterricola silvestris]BDU74330.1 EmrB/QacA family drug resistance transporter [Mesoterricola silvestris]
MPFPRTPNSAAKPGVNPWIVAVVISLATFMEVLDTSIANVALGHIGGSLGASQSQATWVLTSYLAANAIIIPISGWLSNTLGRKRFYMICVALFTFSSFLCGIAPSLGVLLLCRVVQGAGGGGLAPSEQSMLADTFPGKYFGMAFAVYGVAVVAAPAIGPTLGGWITDNFSWRWIFFMNVPVGLVSLLLTQRLIQDPPKAEGQKKPVRVDAMGFAFVVLAFGALQVFLDKGQESDWFGSPTIVVLFLLTLAGFIGLAVWETLVEKDPVVDLPLLRNGNLATSMGLQFVVGFILNSTTVLVPLLAQQLLGYDATQAGLVLMPGGLMLMVMMPVAGTLVRRVQPKYLMAFGLSLLALSLVMMSGFTAQIAFHNLLWARLIQCLGLPLFFIPLNTIAYGNLPPGKSNQASAMMNLMRNLGGSIGIAVATTLLVRRAQVHQAYLAATATRANMPLMHHLHATGGLTPKGLAGFYNQVQVQAAMLSYLDVFRILTVACGIVIAVVLMLRRVRKDVQPVMGH